jgi:thiamine-phosphate pyrophosphorylase
MDSLLRMLDANANRAREALRVCEDVARFELNDAPLQSALKTLRHDLTAAIAAHLPAAIAHRDTAGDVGTAATTAAEQTRVDVAHVAIAAGKRLGEALRAIEESIKTVSPADAAKVERVRYRFYDVERQLALSLKPRGRLRDARLCVLITESACRLDWFDTARLAIDGGADVLQLREKSLESGELLKRAERLTSLCHDRKLPLIVNDRPDVALLSGADGVHVGQGDLPALAARRLVGERLIVGVSTHSLEHALQARRDGADYIGVGPAFVSPTKPRDFSLGPALCGDIAKSSGLPTFAIAGVTVDNVDQLVSAGVRAIAVTAAVTNTPDPAAAAAELKRRLV